MRVVFRKGLDSRNLGESVKNRPFTRPLESASCGNRPVRRATPVKPTRTASCGNRSSRLLQTVVAEGFAIASAALDDSRTWGSEASNLSANLIVHGSVCTLNRCRTNTDRSGRPLRPATPREIPGGECLRFLRSNVSPHGRVQGNRYAPDPARSLCEKWHSQTLHFLRLNQSHRFRVGLVPGRRFPPIAPTHSTGFVCPLA
jgi:hypothetical protein